MPMKRGKKNASSNISEFHKGQTYAKAKAKFGKKKADRIAVAAGLAASRRKKKKGH
jgi:hypothetical protein